jgi:hypothetical protein
LVGGALLSVALFVLVVAQHPTESFADTTAAEWTGVGIMGAGIGAGVKLLLTFGDWINKRL